MRLRTRRLLTLGAVLGAAAPIAALGLPDAAGAASLDVYSVHGSAAAVRVTVQTGYSFVVQPDAMIPRATAAIEADRVTALASPLDPGDDVDALPGLGVPTVENSVKQGFPPPFSGPVGTVVDQYVSRFNPALTYAYEHAVVQYPNPSSPGPQRATYPVNTGGNPPVTGLDPTDFGDPLGMFTAHSTVGSVSASEGSGIADAGAGSAVSIPALGLRIGRTSSHAEMHGGGSSAAVSSVVTTLHDVDLAGGPPGTTSLLHIGSLALTATTQRAPGAARATVQSNLEAAGVTVAGQAARLDEHGLTVLGSPSPLNDVARTLVDKLNDPECVPKAPIGVPNGGPQITSQPGLRIGVPTLQQQVTHNGNQAAANMTGLTLCLATTVPVPNTNAQPAPTPTIYTVTLGDAHTTAYGASIAADPATAPAQFSPTLPQTSSLGGVDTSVPGDAGAAAAAAPPATAPAHPAPGAPKSGGRGLVALLTGGLFSRRAVVTVAALAELALLGALWSAYLRTRRPPAPEESPTTRMDLV
ncbi:MAG TPA: hypothetical protein VGQ42_05585 [Candidatus Dormibacteraeota bacterium]|jgi:hypothetical protein|nr:hypothetical protein [Candidatus Dormibacteraeota bacterium]